MKVTRQDLYDRLWGKPTTLVAKELGISDVAVAKICQKHDIPKPPPGYWAKVQHGKKPRRTTLQPANDPALEEIVIVGDRRRQDTNTLPESVAEKIEQERDAGNRIIVPESLECPHDVVERTQRSLRSASPDSIGIVSPKAKQTLNVAIGKDSVDRAMRILDSLLKAVEARGMKVGFVQENNERVVAITFEGEAFSLRMSESIGERERSLTAAQRKEIEKFPYARAYQTREKYPRGLFALNVRSREDCYVEKRWSELDGRKLEVRLNRVVAWLHQAAQEVKDRRRQREEYERQRAIDEKRRRAEEEYRSQQKLLRAQLRDQMDRWERAKSIRNFVAAAKAKGGSVELESDLSKWLDWALQFAAEIDPLRDPIQDLPKRHKKDYLPYNYQAEFE